MRIISGKFKGKKILEPRDNKTRPLKDLAKESIFNILSHSKKIKIDLVNSNVLDLFSGVGSFGIECLSRGVKKVTFVENYKGVLPILVKNLENLKTIKNYNIIAEDINLNLNFCKFDKKFDLIFLDPPFREKNLVKILQNINECKILKDNGVIIIHRYKKEKDIFQNYLSIIEEKNYGISKIIFLSSS